MIRHTNHTGPAAAFFSVLALCTPGHGMSPELAPVAPVAPLPALVSAPVLTPELQEAINTAAAEANLDPASFWDGWEGSVEAGINGSDGNSENFNVRVAAGGKRITRAMETGASIKYLYATDDGDTSNHRAEAELRNDWNFDGSPWGLFALGRAEYDEFQSWKYRTSAFVGPFYRVIDEDATKFKVRAGAGFTREYGKEARNEIIPEFDLGFDLQHRLTERQRIFWSFDYYPSPADFSEFRLDTKAGWEVMIDPEANLFLKLGVEDRYNSEPGEGKKRNDVNFFATIGWKF